MRDKYEDLLERLFAAARQAKPDPAAQGELFEIRLMARIGELQGNQALWPLWSWRLIPYFVTIVLIVGIGALIYDPARSSDLFASFTNGYEEYLASSLLVGG